MKKMIVILTMGISAAVFAGENLILNGGFEIINKIPKASSKYIMGRAGISVLAPWRKSRGIGLPTTEKSSQP